jgi:hypothetical protein
MTFKAPAEARGPRKVVAPAAARAVRYTAAAIDITTHPASTPTHQATDPPSTTLPADAIPTMATLGGFSAATCNERVDPRALAPFAFGPRTLAPLGAAELNIILSMEITHTNSK